jgi:hypothetical protein
MALYPVHGQSHGQFSQRCGLLLRIVSSLLREVYIVIHFGESTNPWERAFLSAQFWSTTVFWQCVVSLLVPWTAIAATAVHLSTHKPTLFESLRVAGSILCIALILYTVIFVGRAAKIRRQLQQANGEPGEYKGLVLTAKSLTLRFVRISLGLGIAISIIQIYLW